MWRVRGHSHDVTLNADLDRSTRSAITPSSRLGHLNARVSVTSVMCPADRVEVVFRYPYGV
jgi:hypothetical protein